VFKIRTLLLLWQLQHQPAGLNIHSLFSSPDSHFSHKYNTRKKQNFKLQFKSSSHVASLTFKLLLLWNNIPSNIRSLGSLKSFDVNITDFITNS
jgi:hypothetical protein